MGLDTKTYWVTDRQSQCDFDFVSSAVGIQLVQLGNCSEIGDSQRGREAVNADVQGPTTLEAVTRQRLVKTQQTEKT
jgi:hypothetical protein